MSDKERCKNCRCFIEITPEHNGDDFGRCRRYPPVLSPLDTEGQDQYENDSAGNWTGRYEHDFVHWVYPVVDADSWCGEWRKNK